MLETYRTILTENRDEITIEKSRFIGHAAPIDSEEAALDYIKRIKASYPGATHHVHAYVVGEQNQIQRYNDDGEPSGTGGVPALEVIKKEDLRNVVVVITRYFGGIKLGAGGLVRAYTKGAKIGLEAGRIVVKRLYRLLDINIDYTLLGKAQNELLQKDFYIKEIKYDEAVHLLVYIVSKERDTFVDWVRDMTNGRCQISELEEVYLNEEEGRILK